MSVDRGEQFGREYERVVVVDWLMKQSREARYKDQRNAAYEFARAIEQGEHLYP